MYRDIIYTSLAKVNPAFLSRLSTYDRLEGFIDNFSEFAGDAHFQIEKQIIEQYTQSEEYDREKENIKKVNHTLRSIDDNVMKMIPELIEQALMPGSEMMEQLEREEDEIENFEKTYRQLFRDRALDNDSGAGIILEEGGYEELQRLAEPLEMQEETAPTLESMVKHQLKMATEAAARQDRKAAEAQQEKEQDPE